MFYRSEEHFPAAAKPVVKVGLASLHRTILSENGGAEPANHHMMH